MGVHTKKVEEFTKTLVFTDFPQYTISISDSLGTLTTPCCAGNTESEKVDPRDLICDYCHMAFPSIGRLRRHNISHKEVEILCSAVSFKN